LLRGLRKRGQSPGVFGIFLVVQACALLIVAFVFHASSVFRALLTAQAALIGVGLGIGPIERVARIVAAVIIGTLFAVLMTTLGLRLDMAGIFGMHGYGWQFLMITVRALVIAGIYWHSFLRKAYMLSTSDEPFTDPLLRFRVVHALALMTMVALFIVIIRNLASGRFYGVSLVVYVTLLGIAYALMDLLASLLSLERTYTVLKTIAYVLAILAFAFAIAAHAYLAASGWSSAMFTCLEMLVEVGWICGSLIVLRASGYRLAKVSAATDQ
jgi:hypothetical protein